LSDDLLNVTGLAVDYRVHGTAGRRSRTVHAVRDVTFSVAAGEFVALVGASGSGKSSLANAVMGLVRPTHGAIALAGADLTALRGRAARHHRRPAQLVMQDPYQALDPHMTIGAIVAEPLIVHRIGAGTAERRHLVEEALHAVGLRPAAAFLPRHPAELSGGQRQRVCIAAALIVRPALIVADEPVSMLDVSVRAGILHLLDEQRRRATGILMITHDLPTAAAFADRIMVMHDGRLVEQGPPARLLAAPEHDHTRALLDATPRLRRTPTPARRDDE
jgi:peptide/nickel transport system ATP-binding protein